MIETRYNIYIYIFSLACLMKEKKIQSCCSLLESLNSFLHGRRLGVKYLYLPPVQQEHACDAVVHSKHLIVLKAILSTSKSSGTPKLENLKAMSEEDTSMSIKVVVNKKNDRVVFVESNHDFVDVLLSFLTLPIGTIIRLTRNDQSLSSTKIGCMSNLYKSVESLPACHFTTEECKNMLLFPRRALEAKYHDLKFNIDDKEPTKLYYCCYNHRISSTPVLSYSKRFPCSCSTFRYSRMASLGDSVADGGVFVRDGSQKYIITEDLQIKPLSTDTCISILRMHGIQDPNGYRETTMNITMTEVLYLLKCSLISNRPLTDAILLKGKSQEALKIVPKRTDNYSNGKVAGDVHKVNLKLMVSKATRKVLYAEANENFIDLLFSSLTYPLGSIIKHSGGNSLIGHTDNLYKSVLELSSKGIIKSEQCKAMLENPKLATHYRCDNQLLNVDEEENRYMLKFEMGRCLLPKVFSPVSGNISDEEAHFLINPKSVIPGKASGGGFIRAPATYMVTDDLVVTQLCFSSVLSFLESLSVPFNDVEEQSVSIGEEEALNILIASLRSETALSAICGSTKSSCTLK